MRDETKRVVVYTAALLLAPVPVMPFERGTRGFALALVACGAALALASLYVVRGEWPRKGRPLWATKMLAAAVITSLFGAGLVVGSVLYLLLRDA
jgi:hypothetical protein